MEKFFIYFPAPKGKRNGSLASRVQAPSYLPVTAIAFRDTYIKNGTRHASICYS